MKTFRKTIERQLWLEIEKKETKKLKTFQKLLEKISQSPQHNQSRKSQKCRGNVYEETDQELGISGNTVPYLNNPSEEELKSNIMQ